MEITELEREKRRNRGYIDEEDLARLRAGLGRVRYPPLTGGVMRRNNEVATRDAIRHFADGIGDPNPLWRDEDYARNTKYGGIIAPPLFLNAILPGQGGEPIGTVAFNAGLEWEWFRTMYENDRMTVASIPVDIIDKTDKGERRRILQVGKFLYRNQIGDLVGICTWKTINLGRDTKSENRKHSAKKEITGERYHYTDEEIEAIERAYQEEEIRGAKPRYWEDTNVGDELKPVVKGPLTLSDMIAFNAGISWLNEAHGLMLKAIENHGFGWRDTNTGVKEYILTGHFTDTMAQKLGFPMPMSLGVQTACWLGHLMTNWMGDDAFLSKLSSSFKRLIYHGDTTWCKGKIEKKYARKGEHLVDCDVWCENQRGEITTTGHATVVLSSRSVNNKV
jgi:acyl dehydratase